MFHSALDKHASVRIYNPLCYVTILILPF